MKTLNKSTGNKGEGLAEKHLIENGYQIIEKNFRTRFGEIDTICQYVGADPCVCPENNRHGIVGADPCVCPENNRHGIVGADPCVRPRIENPLVFVEVKTKITNAFGTPEEMINKGKLNKVRKMAEVYLTQNNLHNSLCRIDVIAITLDTDGSVLSLNHYENVY